MNNLLRVIALASAALTCLPTTGFGANGFNQNLFINGDAEANAGSPDGSVVPTVTGFVTTGNFTVTRYGASGGFPDLLSPGPTDRGMNFFSGGPSNSASSGMQHIDVSNLANAIDFGQVSFNLAAYLGGYSTQEDYSILSLAFLDTAKISLGTSAIGPVTAADRQGLIGFSFREILGDVPIGTRSIDANLAFNRIQGSYNDGYADNLSLKLVTAPVPEAESYALFLVGLATVWLRFRRKSKGDC